MGWFLQVKCYEVQDERLWADFINRHGDYIIGRLSNWSLYDQLNCTEILKCKIHDIVDNEHVQKVVIITS